MSPPNGRRRPTGSRAAHEGLGYTAETRVRDSLPMALCAETVAMDSGALAWLVACIFCGGTHLHSPLPGPAVAKCFQPLDKPGVYYIVRADCGCDDDIEVAA